MPNILGSTRKLHDHEEQLPVFPVPETDSITIPDDWLNNNIEKFEVWIAGHRAKSYTLTNISVDDLRKFFFICRSQRKNIYGEGGAERCSSPGTEFGDLVHVHPQYCKNANDRKRYVRLTTQMLFESVRSQPYYHLVASNSRIGRISRAGWRRTSLFAPRQIGTVPQTNS